MDLYHASSFSVVFARLKKLLMFQCQCNRILNYGMHINEDNVAAFMKLQYFGITHFKDD